MAQVVGLPQYGRKEERKEGRKEGGREEGRKKGRNADVVAVDPLAFVPCVIRTVLENSDRLVFHFFGWMISLLESILGPYRMGDHGLTPAPVIRVTWDFIPGMVPLSWDLSGWLALQCSKGPGRKAVCPITMKNLCCL
jgi:hypothetical protein